MSFLIEANIVVPIPLTEEQLTKLSSGETIDIVSSLQEGDTFFVDFSGTRFPVQCKFRMGDICRIRRLNERETSYNLRKHTR